MKISVVYGQTATGKTSTALRLAAEQNADIINADARQVYEGLTIVSGADLDPAAKLKVIETEGELTLGYHHSPHHKTRLWLHSVIKPSTQFSSHHFVQLTERVLTLLQKEQKNAILVGGSGHYLRHLLAGFSAPSTQDWTLRYAYESKSLSQLQEELTSLSPDCFAQLNPSDRANKRRIIRHIEKILNPDPHPTPALPLSARLGFSVEIHAFPHFHATPKLAQKAIQERVSKRWEQGAVKEIQSLLNAGYQPTDPGLSTIGCPQILSYLKGELTQEQATQVWTTKEVQYAKRQKTYFTKYPPQSSPAR